ncbi:MAG: hypothetical protein ABFD54_13675 [Armatimonadota bacterium]|nr:hypothetical protein [bacterium]
MSDIFELEEQLNSPDAIERSEVLCSLAFRIEAGMIPSPPVGNEVNLRLRTSLSMITGGLTPTALAWNARKQGLLIAGMVDHDTLEGVVEFLASGDILNQQTVAGIEVDTSLREYSQVIHMIAGGCCKPPDIGSRAAMLAEYICDNAQHGGEPCIVEHVIEMSTGMGAVPTWVWPKGFSSLHDAREMAITLEELGVAALAITISDSNDISDAVELACEFNFPLLTGFEAGQRSMSDPSLEPYIDAIANGASFFWGHTFMERNAGMGFSSEWARSHFAGDRIRKNEFYIKVGRLLKPGDGRRIASGANFRSASPNQLLKALGIGQ